jgi:cytochrome c oxidase assembly protein Cox11
VKSDGTLWAWGYNWYGQLGDERTTDNYSPERIGTDSNWVSVSAGLDHTGAVKSDGTLWAWGANYYGQLGDGTTLNRYSPAQIGTDTNWVSVAAGYFHMAALKSDGTLWAWGGNTRGELGDGTTTDSYNPEQISMESGPWVSVAAGSHTVAVKSDGTLWAWGPNWAGQLGDATTTDQDSPEQITTVGSYSVTPAAGANGNISPKTPQTVYYRISFAITANSGYYLSSATGCAGTLVGSTYTTGLVTSNCTVSATFASVDHITLSPAAATISAGGGQSFIVHAFDASNNSLGDVTGSTTFSITPDGSCTGAACTATVAGSHKVTATYGGKTATVTLTVKPGSVDHITLSPATATISAGDSQSYTATSFDQYNNSLDDVTGSTTFSITPDGSCTGTACTATVAGPHTVTGTYGGMTATASLSVSTMPSQVTFGTMQPFWAPHRLLTQIP